MEATTYNNIFTKEIILQDLIEILQDITLDWEMEFADKIGPQTCLVADLTFESMDVVQLVIAIEEHFQQQQLSFQKVIMTDDGSYVDDLQVSNLVDFLYSQLNSRE